MEEFTVQTFLWSPEEKETIKICSSKKYDHSELNHTQDKASLMANISILMGNYLKKPLSVFSEISY